ncbi:MAG: hypothetical protein KVP17_002256 [Porospora cf. gigantea B]|uniref:uncharacterized protein n=1 Tax=Porospora cf. gigantea B TaxID=2853592 RepID=UPI003571A851|nr:MAG: hypothetical protein KVP17_002256 [Porospora cf. gigantea B]
MARAQPSKKSNSKSKETRKRQKKAEPEKTPKKTKRGQRPSVWDLVKNDARLPRVTKEVEVEPTPEETFRMGLLQDLGFESPAADFEGSVLQPRDTVDDIFSSTVMDEGNRALGLDVDGNFVIQDATPTKDNFFDLIEGRHVVSENLDGLGKLPRFDGAYKVTRTTKWSEEQTNRLYLCLRMFGTDHVLIQSHFPEFTQDQVRRKVKIEMRKQPSATEDCLDNPIPITTELFEKIRGTINPMTHYRYEDDELLALSDS